MDLIVWRIRTCPGREGSSYISSKYYITWNPLPFPPFSCPSGKQWSTNLLCAVVCYLCVCRCTYVCWCKGIGMCWCGDQRSTSALFFWCCHSFKTVHLLKNIIYVYNVLRSRTRGDLSLGPVNFMESLAPTFLASEL